ncbi:MAG: hypothetical protein V1775_12780 [Bacteroidota bacterium]
MKNLLLILFLASCLSASSQVAINTDGADPDNSAMLDVKSTLKGVLFPRMTTSEREAIASPATGLSVYDLTTQSYWYYNGTAWSTIGNGIWTQNGNNIYSDITGNAGIGTVTPGDKLHLYNSTNLRLMIETPDTYYAGIVTRNAQREFFTGTIENRWSVFDNYVGGERISVLPDGNVGIATTTPDPSALLDVSSATKGFLPPRMTSAQRNAIAAPAEGLVIYNTDEKALNVYNGTAWASAMPVLQPFECGYSFTVHHSVAGGVAPVNKSVTYGTVTGIPGNPTKCWITSNLGASRQAAMVSDASEVSAGWYWQFNRKQGYKHDGSIRTPDITWITNINENFNWQPENDPCSIELGTGWRLPTAIEWTNVDNYWSDWNGAFNSSLALHAAGFLNFSNAFLSERGSRGAYWSSSQNSSNVGESLIFTAGSSTMGISNKSYGFSVRCLFSQLVIGDSLQGGKIAYILQPGDPGYIAGEVHGLIAAHLDPGIIPQWGCYGTAITGADGAALGTGNQNTTDIMAGCTEAGIAARICGDLVINGFSDWYLPSKDELNMLYINRIAIGGFAGAYYWSSTEYDNDAAWIQFFGNGFQVNGGKNFTAYVCAVRVF